MFEESVVVVAFCMTSQWRHKVLSFPDMDSFWCRWAWNSTVNELDSTCCQPNYTSNYSSWPMHGRSLIFCSIYRIYREETTSKCRKSIIWLMISLWLISNGIDTKFEHKLGFVFRKVCAKVRCSILSRCHVIEADVKGAITSICPPPVAGGWRGRPAAAGICRRLYSVLHV